MRTFILITVPETCKKSETRDEIDDLVRAYYIPSVDFLQITYSTVHVHVHVHVPGTLL